MAADDPNLDELKAKAKEAVDAIPAETALGNRDPEGGGAGTPAEYEAAHGESADDGE
jgi:hypothetical protein